MASNHQLIAILAIVFITILLQGGDNNNLVEAQLRRDFYKTSCPPVRRLVRSLLLPSLASNPLAAMRIIRLFYVDCFVNGCDGSILLKDNSTFTGEQNAAPNHNSLQGFEIIDRIKSLVELRCPGVVSCADILALAATESYLVVLRLGLGLRGSVKLQPYLGRRDSKTASQAAVNNSLPLPTWSLNQLITRFAEVGLSHRNLVALSGAHNFGYARCKNFQTRIYNDTNIDPKFAKKLQTRCQSPNHVVRLSNSSYSDLTDYYKKLIDRRGVLHSDQELFNGGVTDSIVRGYAKSPEDVFLKDFWSALVRMSRNSPLTGTSGEIRKVCWRTN